MPNQMRAPVANCYRVSPFTLSLPLDSGPILDRRPAMADDFRALSPFELSLSVQRQWLVLLFLAVRNRRLTDAAAEQG